MLSAWTIRYNSVQFSTIQYNSVQFNCCLGVLEGSFAVNHVITCCCHLKCLLWLACGDRRSGIQEQYQTVVSVHTDVYYDSSSIMPSPIMPITSAINHKLHLKLCCYYTNEIPPIWETILCSTAISQCPNHYSELKLCNNMFW